MITNMSGFDEPEKAPTALSAVTVLLTAAAGAINVVTFFSFNQVFASTMSGNLVLIGLGLGQGEFATIIDNICAVLAFCAGLVLGTWFCGQMMRRHPWREAVGAALTLELVILIGVGILLHESGGHDSGRGLGVINPVLLVLASGLAMGVQAAATRYIGPAGTPTSFLSGTVTNWVSSLAESPRRTAWSWNSPLRILAMACAAAGNAVVQKLAPAWAFVVPVALVAAAVLTMLRVVRANHDSVFTPAPQLVSTDAEREASTPVVTALRADHRPTAIMLVGEECGASPTTLARQSTNGIRRWSDPEGP